MLNNAFESQEPFVHRLFKNSKIRTTPMTHFLKSAIQVKNNEITHLKSLLNTINPLLTER